MWIGGGEGCLLTGDGGDEVSLGGPSGRWGAQWRGFDCDQDRAHVLLCSQVIRRSGLDLFVRKRRNAR